MNWPQTCVPITQQLKDCVGTFWLGPQPWAVLSHGQPVIQREVDERLAVLRHRVYTLAESLGRAEARTLEHVLARQFGGRYV
jgi:hypothetical protein